MPSLKPNGKRLNGTGSGWITKQRRLAIYLRDSFTCAYCGKSLHGAHPREVTLDHLTPQCDGGSHESSNLITACGGCNFKRQHKGWRSFLREKWDTVDETGSISRALTERVDRLRRRVPNVALAKSVLAGDVSTREIVR